MHRITFYPRSLCLASTLDCHFLSVNWHRLYFLMPNASITYRASLERISCKNNFFGVSLKTKKLGNNLRQIDFFVKNNPQRTLQYQQQITILPTKVAIFVNCTEYSHVLQYCTYTGHIRVFELRYKNCFYSFFLKIRINMWQYLSCRSNVVHKL